MTDVQIKRQNRKSLSMRVNAAGEVIVSIPRWMKPSHPTVKQFMAEGLKKLESHIPAEKPTPQHDAKSIRALVYEWAGKLDVQPSRVQFRQMTRKWGSCSAKGSVTLNTAMFYLPQHLVEYVVVHELAHLIELNHSPAFWAILADHLPDYAASEAELNQYRV